MAEGSLQTPGPGSMLPAEPIWRRALGFFLLPLSIPYRLVVSWRRRHWRGRSIKLEVPVVSVGNLTCGGTGKTPTVEMLSRDLRERGWNPAILSRGYGAAPTTAGEESQGNDECRVLRQNLPEVEHLQGADRVASGREAIQAGADVLVLDDGFQHLRLHRDLDLVLLDALRPFDRGRLLPAGLLREPVEALVEADLLAVTRVELVSAERRELLVAFLGERFPDIPLLLLESKPVCWRDLAGETLEPGALAGERVYGFCGIGNPSSFQLALEELVDELAGFHSFRDHHPYDSETVAMIAERARQRKVETIVMTQKDAVKLDPSWLEAEPGLRWLFLRIEQSIVSGHEAYDEALGALPGRSEG